MPSDESEKPGEEEAAAQKPRRLIVEQVPLPADGRVTDPLPQAPAADPEAEEPGRTGVAKPKMRPSAFSFRFAKNNEWRVLTGYPGTLKLNYDLILFNEGPGTVVVTLNGIHKHLVAPGKTEHFLFESTSTVSLVLHHTSASMRASGMYELVLEK